MRVVGVSFDFADQIDGVLGGVVVGGSACVGDVDGWDVVAWVWAGDECSAGVAQPFDGGVAFGAAFGHAVADFDHGEDEEHDGGEEGSDEDDFDDHGGGSCGGGERSTVGGPGRNDIGRGTAPPWTLAGRWGGSAVCRVNREWRSSLLAVGVVDVVPVAPVAVGVGGLGGVVGVGVVGHHAMNAWVAG